MDGSPPEPAFGSSERGAVEPPRLSPAMASTRLLVLHFIRDYIGRWGYSPSQGEIAHGLNVTRRTVRNALRSLAEEGLILRRPGQRGISLPTEREAALQTLEALGWTVLHDREAIAAPAPSGPDLSLLPPPALVYPAAGSDGEHNGGQGD